MYLLGVLAFVLGLAVSIGLHEIGHLVPAKRFGVKVSQYMIGFGPTVWSRRRGETEYGVKAIPLGGYIRMLGMLPPRKGDAPGMVRNTSTGRFGQLADEARQASLEEIKPGDEDRVFYKLRPGRKIVVMLGGPFMNLVLAAVGIAIVVTTYGVEVPRDGARIVTVSQCVVPAEQARTKTTCDPNDPLTPAAKAGLRPDDVVVAIEGQAVREPEDLSRIVRPRVDQPTEFVVERDGGRVTLTVTPVLNTLEQYDEQGQPVLNPDGTPATIETGFIGITRGTPTVIEQQSLAYVPGATWETFSGTAGLMAKLPQKMVGVADAAFGDAERDPTGPVSIVGVGNIIGKAASGGIPWLPDTPAAFWALFGSLMAGLNMALFVFNLIPLLPLDGGHVAGAALEWVRKGVARLRGRPDPGYVDVAKALPVAYAMSIVLIVMSALLMYADLVNPIDLG